MEILPSLWDLLSRKARLLDLPKLDELALPRAEIVRELLASRVCWIVGPPKVGKTVLAHYVGYLKCLGLPLVNGLPPMMSFEGGPECARAVDLLIEAPYAADIRLAIFENPFGASGSRSNTVFLKQLQSLVERRPEVSVIVTTRPAGYVSFAGDISLLDHYATPLALSEWYDSRTLESYASRRGVPTVTADLLGRLPTPAMLDDFALHEVTPRTESQRATLRHGAAANAEDVTLDKLAVLQERPELGLLAMLVRLQEHAPTLPTAREISELVGFGVESHPHAGLVVVPYKFDGLTRLRFEHSTAREAADILLAAEGSHAAVRATSGVGIGEWLNRALDLWDGQQDIRRSDWPSFNARRQDVRLALASDVLALSGAQVADAVASIEDLDYDRWTAQDLGYELSSSWPELSSVPAVRDLMRRLLEDGPVDGAYAVLEALLYIRSPDVKELWDWLDEYLLRLAAGATEPAQQLLLALDGLAWRHPPEWHELGAWAASALRSLTPDGEAWGFVRFMAGYHPEGVDYLERKATRRVKALLIEDEEVEWTPEQAATASWLVQWHFIHQCRARAQFARQPWVDQQFLCRSFHAVLADSDRDRGAARLARSLLESSAKHADWAFFLTENLRAVAPEAHGPLTLAEARRALQKSPAGATGVLAAVLTYSIEPSLIGAVREHFQNPQAVERLMQALTEGLVVAGARLLEPRFSYRRDLSSIYRTCGLEWAAVKAVIPPEHLLDANGAFDVDGLIRRLDGVAESHPFRQDPESDALLIEALRRIRLGDLTLLRPLSHRAPAGTSTTDCYTMLVQSAVAALAEDIHES